MKQTFVPLCSAFTNLTIDQFQKLPTTKVGVCGKVEFAGWKKWLRQNQLTGCHLLYVLLQKLFQ